MVQRLLLQAQTAVASYADPEWAAERGWPLLVDALRFRLDTALPGSDAQLAVVNALAGSVLPQSVLTSFQGWLLDVAVPPGLIVDTDLRWRILQALVANGAATEAEIDAEAQRDPTSTGQRQAERARALIPTAEAKERAWQRAVHDDDLPNAVQEAIIGGFSHPAQRPLLMPYVERYFAEVAEVWARRTSERAQSVVVGLFPSWAVEKPDGRRGRRLVRRRRATRPRCAGWCRKAGPGSCGRWPRGSSTAHSARRPVSWAEMTAADAPCRCSCPARCARPVARARRGGRGACSPCSRVRYAGTSTAGGVDARVDAVVDPLGCRAPLARPHAAALGSPPSVVVLAFALSAMCLLLGRRRLAVLAVVGPGLTGVCTTLLKPALGRTIEGGFAFPSGHTGGATSLGLVARAVGDQPSAAGHGRGARDPGRGRVGRRRRGGCGDGRVQPALPHGHAGRVLHRGGGGVRRGAACWTGWPQIAGCAASGETPTVQERAAAGYGARRRPRAGSRRSRCAPQAPQSRPGR